MERERFLIDSYIAPTEAFHFARKQLAKRWPARAHDHDFYEFVMVVRGSTSHWINGVEEALTPGDALCIRPWDTHAFRAHRTTGCEIVNVMFRPSTAEHFQARYGDTVRGRFFWHDHHQPTHTHLTGPRLERAVNVATELQTSHRTLAGIEEFLLTLINRVFTYTDRLQHHAPRWLVSACAAAQREEVFRLGAAGLVQAAGRSHEHVCRAVQQHLGMTPSAYMNRLRMEFAAQLLGASDDSIADIAARCGIENLGHFYRLFGHQYGTTPLKYRKRHQKDPFVRAS